MCTINSRSLIRSWRSEINKGSAREFQRPSAWIAPPSDCWGAPISTFLCRNSWRGRTSRGASSCAQLACRCWWEEQRRDGWVDSRAAAPDRRHVEEIEHYMKGNPGGRKSNWIRRGERQPACGCCGVGSGLVHIKLWRGKWSGSRGGNNSTTPWEGGRVRGGGCGGGVGVPAEQVPFRSSSLFNQPFFGQKPPSVLHRPRASGTAGWIYRSIRRRRPSE